MYFRIQIDAPNDIEPFTRYLEAASHIHAFEKAKQLLKGKIIAIIDAKEFFYKVVIKQK